MQLLCRLLGEVPSTIDIFLLPTAFGWRRPHTAGIAGHLL
jgi:hypothetical protein